MRLTKAQINQIDTIADAATAANEEAKKVVRPPYTPGPWNEHRGYIEATGFGTIASIYDFNGNPCAKADGKLIAAAPELLSALKLLVDMYSGENEDREEMLVAIAAIAKAEGRQA